MFTFKPSLTLNIGQRKDTPKAAEPVEAQKRDLKVVPKPTSSVLVSSAGVLHPDTFQFLVICLAITLVLLAGIALIHAARA